MNQEQKAIAWTRLEILLLEATHSGISVDLVEAMSDLMNHIAQSVTNQDQDESAQLSGRKAIASIAVITARETFGL